MDSSKLYITIDAKTKRARLSLIRTILHLSRRKKIKWIYNNEPYLVFDVDAKELIGVHKIESVNVKCTYKISDFFDAIFNPPLNPRAIKGAILTAREIAKFKSDNNPEEL